PRSMVLLALPPADHLLIERDRGQFMPSRRRRMMANVRARLLKIPAEPGPELRIPTAAAQTRVVSRAGIRFGSWESARAFKGIICVDISEFESHMPSHAVRYPSSRWGEDCSGACREANLDGVGALDLVCVQLRIVDDEILALGELVAAALVLGGNRFAGFFIDELLAQAIAG